MKVYVYGLADPRTPDVIRYVGKTTAPRVRHIQHCTDAGAPKKCAWVETLRNDGILPQMIILAECPNEAAAMGKERELIAKYNSSEADSFMQVCKSDRRLANSNNQMGRQLILDALAKSRGKIAPAAKMLGISRPTLYAKIQRYQIQTTEVVRAKTGKKTTPRVEIATRHNDPPLEVDLNISDAEYWHHQPALQPL